MADVVIKHNKTGEERTVTRAAASFLTASWSIIAEVSEEGAKEVTNPNDQTGQQSAGDAGAGSEESEILKGLREQYKELTGKEADGLWSDKVLMEEIEKALTEGSTETVSHETQVAPEVPGTDFVHAAPGTEAPAPNTEGEQKSPAQKNEEVTNG